jgi:hypothetical protein
MAIYQPPSYAPPLPPLSPDPHRETPWYRKAWFVGLIGLLLGAAIAGSMTGWVSKTKTVAGPVRVVTSIIARSDRDRNRRSKHTDASFRYRAGQRTHCRKDDERGPAATHLPST